MPHFPTAGGLGEALKSIVLKTSTDNTERTVAAGQDLLAQIREGVRSCFKACFLLLITLRLHIQQKKLRPVKRDEDSRRGTFDPRDQSVQAILMRRFALEASDESADEGGSDDEWSD